MTEDNRALAHQFFRWWCRQPGAIRPPFSGGLEVLRLSEEENEAELWLWECAHAANPANAELLDVVCEETKAVLFAVFTDDVTAMRHRATWLLQIERGEITRVVCTMQRIAPRGEWVPTRLLGGLALGVCAGVVRGRNPSARASRTTCGMPLRT